MLTNILALAPAAVDPQVTEDTASGLVGLLHHLAQTPTAMQTLWFVLIAVLWTGYLVLEGFDFGVGMLLPIIGKRDNERRAMLSTIGPLWDGNEVWVLTAGGATFAAFPEWYATLFSAAYLPLFLILVGLIIRAVAFEYRGKINGDGWRKLWDWCIIVGSWLPAILWGVAFANLVSGVKAGVDAAQLGSTKILYDGTFWNLVFDHKGFLLLGGLTTAALFLAHGSIFLSLKTDGVVRERSEALAPKLSIAATVIAAIWVLWLGFAYNGGNHPTLLVWIGIILAAVALVAVVGTTWIKKFGYAFAAMTVALLAAVVTIFAGLFPNVINGDRVRIYGDAVADPIVGAVVLGVDPKGGLEGLNEGVDLEDVVNVTFNRIGESTDSLAAAPLELPDDATAAKALELTPLILTDVKDQVYPVLQQQAVPLPQTGIEAVVKATFARVAASGVDLSTVGVGVESEQLADDLTVGVLEDVAAGAFPARGVIPVEDVAIVVDISFARVLANVADLSVIGTDVADDQISPLALTLTKAVLNDAAHGVFPAAQVISQDNVVNVVKITLLRLGIDPTDAVVGAVVADLAAHADALEQLNNGAIDVADLAGETIAGLPADAVATEVGRTVQACVPELQVTVQALVPHIAASVYQIISPDPTLGQVVATLQAVANNEGTRTFHGGDDATDVTDIITGKAWNNDDGLANLNGRIDAANEALNALVTLGLLEKHEPLEHFAKGDVITGQPMNASASSALTLKLMTIVAVCLVPIVLAYQAWSIWVFRRRISAERIPAESGLDPAKV